MLINASADTGFEGLITTDTFDAVDAKGEIVVDAR
jgi:hypothetical protein